MKIDLFFFKLENSFYFILFTTLALLAITIFYYAKNYLNDKHPYHSKQYWESRYSLIPKRIDWYLSFEEIRVKFKLDETLNRLGCNFKMWKVLDLGCGNSTLPLDVIKEFN